MFLVQYLSVYIIIESGNGKSHVIMNCPKRNEGGRSRQPMLRINLLDGLLGSGEGVKISDDIHMDE